MPLDITNLEVEKYIRGFVPPRDALMTELEQQAEKETIPIIRPEVGELLYLLTCLKKPQRVLEIVTAIGYSTLWLVKGMASTGEIVTIEIDETRAAQARENFVRAGVSEKVKLKVGDARDILPALTGAFDLVFMDAAKGQYPFFLENVLPLLKEGSVLITDNILIYGMVVEERPPRRHRTMVKRMHDYLNQVSDPEQWETVMLPVGDGLAISMKKGSQPHES